MKRLFTLALVVLTCASVTFADTKTKKSDQPAGNKAGLQQVVDDYFAGIKASDAKKVGDYFAPDYSFTDLDGKMMNRDQRMKAVAGANNSKTVFSDINVRTYGTTGIVTGMATDAGGSRTRFTMVWVWQGGRWQVEAGQRTSVTQ